MNAALLAVLLWGAAGLGVIAAIMAITLPRRRTTLLLVAAVLFLPIGVLGILSVGALFLVAAVGCVVAAVLSHRGQHPQAPEPFA